MKHKIAPAILVLSLFLGCKKARMMEKFSGKWEYEQFIGFPFDNTYLPPGNGRIVILNDDGTYIRKNNDTVVFKGKYSIKRKDDCYSRANNMFFVTGDPHYSETYVEVNDNKLSFSTPNCLMDGGTTYLRRID